MYAICIPSKSPCGLKFVSVHTMYSVCVSLLHYTYSELSTAGNSSPLATIIAKNIKKAIKLFNIKCDELTVSGRSECVQVSGAPNHAQLRNITVVNTLHTFNTIMNQVEMHVLHVHVHVHDIVHVSDM